MIRSLLAMAIVAALLPAVGRAAVFSRDWKAAGDGLLTYDDVNRREWLDLTESRLALLPGIGVMGRYQSLLEQLGAGGSYAGFSAARAKDVVALSSSAGISATRGDFAWNEVPTTNLIHLLGDSHSTNNVQSYGVLNELGRIGATTFQAAAILSVSPNSGPQGQAGLILGMLGDLATFENTGAWLYREVPEPRGVALGCTALLHLCSVRRRPA